ncbi:MAG TPA: histidine kinase dimerization/phospho-acceptor domain-containing protein [Cyclobacteriaceae bacterium]|jgi:signal transduction histidine kinase|nr:histidine kinase dimerization/phospho-acceptor domain-containing protein [Cyclobacteriaceae bacterium]
MRPGLRWFPIQNDLTYTVLFGLSSIVLSQVQFHIPGVGESNLREIPLLICIFHVRRYYSVFILGLFTLFGSSAQVSYWTAYVVHLVPLLTVAVIFQFLDKRPYSPIGKGAIWMLVALAYYILLLLPFVVFTISLRTGNHDGFWTLYQSILPPLRFEMITSALVTGLYLMQIQTHQALEGQNKNLELVVDTRTKELKEANDELQSLNEELTASNEGIKKLNENLEQMVKDRTEQINNQLNRLRKYAYMNSHELRAPLSRILGLIALMKQEADLHQWNELLTYLQGSSEELDQIVREMNQLLDKEINPS